jgi:hypothetical protein
VALEVPVIVKADPAKARRHAERAASATAADPEPTRVVTAKNPQHLWVTCGSRRRCDVCDARQNRRGGAWQPRILPVCPGDNDEDNPTGKDLP